MGTLFSLSLATSITMSLMWFAYRMIRTSISDGRPQINRAIILGVYLLSLLSMPVGIWIKSFSTHPAYSLAVAGDHTASINMVTLPAVAAPYINERAAETHWDIMLAIYVAGFALAAILTLLSFLRIIIVCLQSEKVMVAGYRVYLTDKRQFSPFCIGRCIVMSRNDFETCRDNIMYHELGHIKNHHTADRVMAQIIAIICWYCPVVWILRRELTSVHEFQADSYVVDNGVDIKTYQLFLIRKAAEPHISAIANHLNNSTLKKRIIMLQKNPTPRRRRRALIILPLLAMICSLSLFATPGMSTMLEAAADSRLSGSPADQTVQESAPLLREISSRFNIDWSNDSNTVFLINGERVKGSDILSLSQENIIGVRAKKERVSIVTATAIATVQNYRTDLVLTTDSAGHRSVVNTSGIPLAVTDRAIFVDSKPITTQELDSINADRIMSFVVDRTLAQPASVYIVTLKPDDLESEK